MRPVTIGHAAVLVLAALLAGCAGVGPTPGGTPAPTTPSTTPAPTQAPASGPPLAADLTGGTPLQLGSAGHWAIADGRAFVAADEGDIVALDLATGSTTWQTGFSLGDPWDVQPTLGLSADRTTVIAARTVDAGDAPALNLLLLDAASGAKLGEHLAHDPDGRWVIDLPPRILAADGDTVVLADNPESGRQTTVLRLLDGTLAWRVDDQAVAATAEAVVTRGAGWSRADGTRLWKADSALGPLLAQAPDRLVVRSETVGVWLDPVSGARAATTGTLDEAEPACLPAAATLVCLTGGVTGYELGSADPLWTNAEPAQAVAAWADWVYLWRNQERGDVLDAGTGEVLATDAELPAIRFADDRGVLLSAENGYRWVALPR